MYEDYKDSFQMCSLTKEQQRLNAGAFWPQKSSRAKRHVAWRDIAILHDLLRYIYKASDYAPRIERTPLPLGHNFDSEIYPIWSYTYGGETLVRKPGWFGDDLLDWVKKWIGAPALITRDTSWKLYSPASPLVQTGHGTYGDLNCVFSSFADLLANTMLYELRDTDDNLAVYAGGLSRYSVGNVALVRQGAAGLPAVPVVSSTRTYRREYTAEEVHDTGDYDDEGNVKEHPPVVNETETETYSPDDYTIRDDKRPDGYGVSCKRERELFKKLMGCNLSDLALPVSSQKIFKRKYNGDFIVPGPSGHMVDACYDAAKCLLTSDLLTPTFRRTDFAWDAFEEHPNDRFYTSTMDRSFTTSVTDDYEGSPSDYSRTCSAREVPAGQSGMAFYRVEQMVSRGVHDSARFDHGSPTGETHHSEDSHFGVTVSTVGTTPQEDTIYADEVSGQNLSFRMYFVNDRFHSSFFAGDDGQPIVSHCRLLLPVSVSVDDYVTTSLDETTYYEREEPRGDTVVTRLHYKQEHVHKVTRDITAATVWVLLTLRPLASKKNRDAGQPLLFRSNETFADVVASALNAVNCGWAYLDPNTSKLSPSIDPPAFPEGGAGCHIVDKDTFRTVNVQVELTSAPAWPPGAAPDVGFGYFSGPIFTASWKPECLGVIWKK